MSSESFSDRLAAFVETERATLVAYVRKLIGDAADRDGEDIVQDVMAGIFGRGDPLMPLRDITAYAYQSIRNRVADTFRTRKKNIPLETDEDDGFSLSEVLSDMRFDADADVANSELRDILVSAMDNLNERERATLIATEIDGYSFRELSEMWEVPMGTLLAQKSRALKKLQESIPLQSYRNQ